ncbi:hypothetical protein PsorP6_017635 [Peronosclerospora sorghi]|uniref:Uncharacterized protein n=1 Tax=Peronosclerospora sorghi TaxID=230839 RepID=A0ACC0WKH9_9STRA|nr:hypothetical protein PsorP6_017635 [Peronosclerospora sorghi]
MAVVPRVSPLGQTFNSRSAAIGTMRICGMPKANCEKSLQKCMASKCNSLEDPTKRDECFSTAKIFYVGANMMACPAYQDAQKEACECVPTADAAAATRERLVYFLETNGAPAADLEDAAVDALLNKYEGREHIMFLRLLKKYPTAIKLNSEKPSYMDEVFQGTKTEVKKQMKKRKKKIDDVPVDEHEEL